MFAIFVEPFALNQHNQLFLNMGGNRFADISATSGIRDLAGFPPGFDGSATISWAIAMVDYDLTRRWANYRLMAGREMFASWPMS
jgi:hypothetical protein